MNPYETGRSDKINGRKASNPYVEFSEKWALYNRGYNKEYAS